jgi:hypothetical protein
MLDPEVLEQRLKEQQGPPDLEMPLGEFLELCSEIDRSFMAKTRASIETVIVPAPMLIQLTRCIRLMTMESPAFKWMVKLGGKNAQE